MAPVLAASPSLSRSHLSSPSHFSDSESGNGDANDNGGTVEGLSSDAFAALVSESQGLAVRNAELEEALREAQIGARRASAAEKEATERATALAAVLAEQNKVMEEWCVWKAAMDDALERETARRKAWEAKVEDRDALIGQLKEAAEELAESHAKVLEELERERGRGRVEAERVGRMEEELAARDARIADLNVTIRLTHQESSEAIQDAISKAEATNTSLRNQLAKARAELQSTQARGEMRASKDAAVIAKLRKDLRSRTRTLHELQARSTSSLSFVK